MYTDHTGRISIRETGPRTYEITTITELTTEQQLTLVEEILSCIESPYDAFLCTRCKEDLE